MRAGHARKPRAPSLAADERPSPRSGDSRAGWLRAASGGDPGAQVGAVAVVLLQLCVRMSRTRSATVAVLALDARQEVFDLDRWV